MILLSLLAATPITPELDALDRAMATCARNVVNPAFAADAGRRSGVMTEIFREQEAIVTERLDNATRRRVLRETRPSGRLASDEDQQLAMAALALVERQRALNDRRMLETMRAEAMDVKRRYYLARCAKGTNNAQD
jgi:hypothetical protein